MSFALNRELRAPDRAARLSSALRDGHPTARSALFALGAITVLAGLLRFSTLGQQSFWYDESVTAWIVKAPLGKALGGAFHETTPPPYYLLVWVWAKVFSNSEVGLRSLSALAGTATAPAAYFAALAGTRSRRIALIAAALIATSPLLVWYSQEARDYAVLVLMTLLSLGFLARALDRPRPLYLAGWAVCSAVALCVHYFAAYFVCAEAVWLLAASRGRFFKLALPAAAAVAAVELAVLPFAVSQTGNGGHWISGAPFRTRLLQIPKQFLVGLQSGFDRPAILIALALCAYAAWLIVRRADAVERRGAYRFAALSTVSVAAPALLFVVGESFLITRNTIAACAPVLIALAAGFGARRGGRLGIAAGAVFACLGLAICVSVFATPDYHRADWRDVGRTIGTAPYPRAIALRYTALPLLYYLPDSVNLSKQFQLQDPIFGPSKQPVAPGGNAITISELDVVAINGSRNLNPVCWWGARCNPPPATPPTDRLPPGLHYAQTTQVSQFTVTRFRSDTPVTLTPQTLDQTSLAPTTLLLQAPHLRTANP